MMYLGLSEAENGRNLCSLRQSQVLGALEPGGGTDRKQHRQIVNFSCASFCWEYTLWSIHKNMFPLYPCIYSTIMICGTTKSNNLKGSPGFQLVDLAG